MPPDVGAAVLLQMQTDRNLKGGMRTSQILTITRKFVWLTALTPLPVRALLSFRCPLTGVRSHVINTLLARDADIGCFERADEGTTLDLKDE